MYIRRQCYSYNCICDNNFDERSDPSQNPNCELVNQKCDLELRHLHQFQKGCAPIYFGDYPTCPDDQYRCREYFYDFYNKNVFIFIYVMLLPVAKFDDRVIPVSNYNYGSDENTCTFGHLTLRVGDKLDDSCYNCACVVPPMLVCRQYVNCQTQPAEIPPISF